MRRVLYALFALSISTGCGDSSAAGTPDAAPPPCMVTLSGAFSGSYGCVATAAEQDGTHVTVMGFVASGLPANLMSASASFQISGAPLDKNYKAADFDGGGALIQTSDNPPVSYSAGVGAAPMGTIDGFDLNLVQPTAHNGSTLLFIIHGTFSGTLVNDAGQSVKMTATF